MIQMLPFEARTPIEPGSDPLDPTLIQEDITEAISRFNGGNVLFDIRFVTTTWESGTVKTAAALPPNTALQYRYEDGSIVSTQVYPDSPIIH